MPTTAKKMMNGARMRYLSDRIAVPYIAIANDQNLAVSFFLVTSFRPEARYHESYAPETYYGSMSRE